MKSISFFRKERKEWLESFQALSLLWRDRIATFFALYGMITTLCGALCFMVFSIVLLHTFLPNDRLVITFFDVGQGDAVLIESGSKTRILIDGGPSQKIVSSLASSLPFFDKNIDLVAPSHADKDHITGSLSTLLTFPVARVSFLHAPSATSLDDEYTYRIQKKETLDLLAGDSLDIGNGALLSVLLPKKGEVFSDKETNESSQVFLLTYQGFSFLLTGDLGVERERLLLQSDVLPRNLTVLKAGHHGSKGSTGNALLSYTKPLFVVISSGKDNSYGHPSKETLDRVAKIGSKVLRTDELGSISFEIRGGRIRVR